VGLRSAGCRSGRSAGVGGHSVGRFCRGVKVGGYLVGRFCRLPSPASRWAKWDPGGSQVTGGCFATNASLTFNLAQRPPQAAQREDLLLLVFAQDIAHVEGA
jgi:hypothetical protein